ncbi:MAG: UPF0175 family protein [Flavobacteriales bacterium]|nr:UPF0175 family protein [Flavobacteriales bacterium]
MSKKLVLEVPDSVEVDLPELMMMLAAQLYDRGQLAMGHAATLAGLDKRTFMERLGKYGVSVFNYPASDLEQDMRNA